MVLRVADSIWETSTTTGTGSYSLAGATTGYSAFSSVCSNNDTCYYCARDTTNGGWEVGLGTFGSSGDTLARTTIFKSTNSNAAVSWSAGTRQVMLIAPADALGVVLPNYLSGCQLSNNGNQEINIATGAAADSTNEVMIKVTSTLTCNVAASGANGLDTGSIAASSWYWFFVIWGPNQSVASLATKASAATTPSPTLPSGYTNYRYVGSCKTNGSSNFYGFQQFGRRFFWNSYFIDVTAASPSSTAFTNYTLTVPLGINVRVLGLPMTNNGGQYSWVTTPGRTWISAGSVSVSGDPYPSNMGGNGTVTGAPYEFWTNTSGQLSFTLGGGSINWVTEGWVDYAFSQGNV